MSLPVGARVGATEGRYVRIAVGDFEGRMEVGGEVGFIVGDRMGHIVMGKREGEAVGLVEGTMDGAAGTAEKLTMK